MATHTIEEKVASLREEVGELRSQLTRFQAVTDASLDTGLIEARRIIEYLVGLVLRAEGITPDRELLNNIEILGGKEGKLPARRKRESDQAVPPPVIPTQLYSTLHNLRIYGNLVAHPWDPHSMELKDVRLTTTDVQVALGQIMRLIEWYFQEYARGPQLSSLYDGLPGSLLGRHSEAPPDVCRFIGRVELLNRLQAALQASGTRILTLVAPAGIGKTTLAARLATSVAAGEVGGRGVVLWHSLSHSSGFGEVSSQILASLLRDANPTDASICQLSPMARTNQIVRLMAASPVFLVLDNLESWLDEGRCLTDPAAAELLKQCSSRNHQSRIVLTSRVVPEFPDSGGSAHCVFRLEPLSLADSGDLLLKAGTRGTPDVVEFIWRSLGGNARLILMLAEYLVKRNCRDLNLGMQRYPKLLASSANGLLSEVWQDVSIRSQLVLQLLAALRPPVPLNVLSGVVARIQPDAVDAVEEILWNDLVPRDLVAPDTSGLAFSCEHGLIRDYAMRQWSDPAVPHRAAIDFFSTDGRQESDDASGATALSIAHHALAIDDFPLLVATLTDEDTRRAVFREGRTTDLTVYLNAALSRITELPDPLRNPLRRLSAICWGNQGEYSAAAKLLEECQAELGDWCDSRDECRVLVELCSIYRKQHRFAEAEAAGRRTIELSQRLQAADAEAWGLLELSALERNRGNPGLSAKLAKEALQIGDRSDHVMVQVIARTNLAATMMSGGNLSRPQRLYEEALLLSRELGGHVRTEAQILQSLANIARRQTRNPEAMALVNQAIEMFVHIGDRTGEGIARQCRGLILHQMGRTHAVEARDEVRRHVRTSMDLDHPREVGNALSSLAQTLLPDELEAAVACLLMGDEVRQFLGVRRAHRLRKDLDYARSLSGLSDDLWVVDVERIRTGRIALLSFATAIPTDEWEAWLQRWRKTAAVASVDATPTEQLTV